MLQSLTRSRIKILDHYIIKFKIIFLYNLRARLIQSTFFYVISDITFAHLQNILRNNIFTKFFI